jgi:dCTP deaminase
VYGPRTVTPGEKAPVHDGIFLSVDLSRDRKLQYVGYKAKKSSALLDLSLVGKYKIADFWDRISLDRQGRLILEPEEFYLLVSRERVRIPRTLAAEMAAYDPTSGELRTHYAGFFDPGFGDVPAGERQGTAAVLEVRAHDVAFALEHGQRLCKLTYERMMAAPDKAYGHEIGSRYQRQYLAVGRQFIPDPPSRMQAEHAPELFGEEPLKLELVQVEPDAIAMDLDLGG